MQARVERRADRIDALEARSLELLPKLLVHQLDGLPKLLAGRGGPVRAQAVHIVQDVQQPADQCGLGAIGQLRALAGDSLAVVVIFRGQPEVSVPRFLELVLEPADCLARGLDRKPSTAELRL